jgi:hypothetical protein
MGSVVSGPDFTGVGTPESNPGWGAHGTWMASLIAGHGHGRGNANGVIGVAPQARILAIRVITDRFDPGYTAYQHQPPSRGQQELARGIRYAVSHGAAVISMSLGYVAPSLVVRAALQNAVNHNVVVVASSGNSGNAQTAVGRGHAPYSFPADYPGVIGVAAVNSSGLPAYFSSDNLSVQVAAPGMNVPAQGKGSHYWLVSGTSPACALTAGVAALIRSKYPGLSAAQVRRAITSSTVNRPPGGYDDQVGFGSLDAVRALAAAKRLARPVPVAGSRLVEGSQTGYFGTGRLPVVPVASRGNARLLELAGLAALCLLLALVFTWRFATGMVAVRRIRKAARRIPAFGTPVPAFGTPVPAFGTPVPAFGAPPGGPATGFGGTVADVQYPPAAYAGQPGPSGSVLPAGPVGPGGTAGPGGLAGPGPHGMPGQAGPSYPWSPDPGAPGHAEWPPPSPGQGPGLGSPYAASAPTVVPGQQPPPDAGFASPGGAFASPGGAFAPIDATPQRPWPGPGYPPPESAHSSWPGPGYAPQVPAEPPAGSTAPNLGYGPPEAAFTATPSEQSPGRAQVPMPDSVASPPLEQPAGERSSPVTQRWQVPPTGEYPSSPTRRQVPPADERLSSVIRRRLAPPDGQSPDQQRRAPATPASQGEDRGSGRRAGAVDPIPSWLDHAYPPQTPDQPPAEPQTLPKRHRPKPSQFGQPPAFRAAGPGASITPGLSTPAGSAGLPAEPRSPAEPRPPRNPSQPPDPAWDPWSPSGTTEQTSAPREE